MANKSARPVEPISRESDKINLPTNKTDLISFAQYLRIFEAYPHISSSTPEGRLLLDKLNAYVRQKTSKKKKSLRDKSLSKDTHIITDLMNYGLLDIFNDEYCISGLGRELLSFFEAESKINFNQFDDDSVELSQIDVNDDDDSLDQEDYSLQTNSSEGKRFEQVTNRLKSESGVRLALKIFSRLKQVDEKRNRHINVGILFIRLLCDARLDCYLTNHEITYITRKSEYISDDQYETIVKDILEFRDGFPYSAYLEKNKTDLFLSSLETNWGLLKRTPESAKTFSNYKRKKSDQEEYFKNLKKVKEELWKEKKKKLTDSLTISLNVFNQEKGKSISEDLYNKHIGKFSLDKDNIPNPFSESEKKVISNAIEKTCDADFKKTKNTFLNSVSFAKEIRFKTMAAYVAIGFLKSLDLDESFDFPKQRPISEPRQKIVFGAPGTGKSKTLKDKALLYFGEKCVERVTFHPNYSYSQFVGSYKPVGEGSDIAYKYVEGPFIRTYVKACLHTDINYVLIIEEINRANVAAVFGDVFQLLDRDGQGESEYPVDASEDLRKFLMEKNVPNFKKLALPKNMYIWATMNSADQGVMPLDTAFKRRWEFEYTKLNITEKINLVIDNVKVPNIDFGKLNIPLQNKGNTFESISWSDFRIKTNKALQALGVNEDKCLGPFFIDVEKLYKVSKILDKLNKNPSQLDEGQEIIKSFRTYFCNKVLMYLYEDAAKVRRTDLFSKKHTFFSEICDDFEEIGVDIFNKKFWENPKE